MAEEQLNGVDPAETVEDLSDISQVRDRKKTARLATNQRKDMLSAVVGLPQGRKLLREIIFDWCHVNRVSFSTEAVLTAFAEGERNIGLRLLADLAPKDYMLLLKEQEEIENG